MTGDPLHSLHGTADLAIANDRRRGVSDVPYWTAQYFGYALREPVVVGIPVGLAFAWLHARRAAALPVAVIAAMVDRRAGHVTDEHLYVRRERALLAGLDAGAEDYVAKPFRMEEVLARLRNVEEVP